MFLVFPLVTFMDYGQIKYFKIEQLKLFPCLFLNNYFLTITKDDIMKRQHFWRRRHLLQSSVPQKMRQICVDFLLRYI